MSDHHDAPSQDYNPARDYKQFMEWSKYGILFCIAVIIALQFF